MVRVEKRNVFIRVISQLIDNALLLLLERHLLVDKKIDEFYGKKSTSIRGSRKSPPLKRYR